MNKIKVIINGKDYSKYVVSPFKFCNLLDEQLDECNLTLRYIDEPYFKPMTEVKITITQTQNGYHPYMRNEIAERSDYELEYSSDRAYQWKSTDGAIKINLNGGDLEEIYSRTFIVASDSSAERVVGSGKYQHEIYLIERTKILEGFIGDNLTFTNPLGATYAGKTAVEFATTANFSTLIDTITKISKSVLYDTPILKGEITIIGVKDFYSSITSLFTFPSLSQYQVLDRYQELFIVQPFQSVKVYKDYTLYYTQTIKTTGSGSSAKIIRTTTFNGTTSEETINAIDTKTGLYNTLSIETTNIEADIGTYRIDYDFIAWVQNSTERVNITTANLNILVSAINDKARPQLWTISSVCERLFDTLEPTRETPRFSLDSEQAEKYSKILAPEFTFTKMTLREQLQQVGGFIHAEPRLKEDTDEIIFEEYGGIKKSNIKNRPYSSYQLKSDINNWCNALDTNAENLVNQLDYASGVAYEPANIVYSTSTAPYITPRTEQATIRLAQDDTTIIPTSLPIYKLKSVKVLRYIKGDTEVKKEYDITPYVFEKSDYNTLLQSNGGVYPYSKGFALYYTQGSKNIGGLWYKEDNPISATFSDFAILNILKKVMNDDDFTLSGNEYYQIGFNIVYTPIYSTRLKTTKNTYESEILYPRTINYNQGANLVETRFLGENLKGVIARMGNIEKTYTYTLAHITDIPKTGMLFDDNYYISTTSTEITQNYIKCTIGLSKDFNKLSEYVGISSNKRMWEVSERQSQQRQSIYTEYLKVSLSDSMPTNKYKGCMRGVVNVFKGGGRVFSIAQLTPKTKDGENVNEKMPCVLPVISSAIGNSLVLTCAFEDNYSAGQQVLYTTTPSGASGYWAQYVPYGDYFGRFYYLDISFAASAYISESATQGTSMDGMKIPQVYPTTDTEVFPHFSLRVVDDCVINIQNWKYRKDNREIPQISYELTAYTNNDKIIIGSALMGNSPLVKVAASGKAEYDKSKIMQLYGFTEPLNRVDGQIDLSKGELLSSYISAETTTGTYGDYRCYIKLPTKSNTSKYKSWAIITEPTTSYIDITDDNGYEVKQKIYTGSELIIGYNGEYKNGKYLNFELKKDIE